MQQTQNFVNNNKSSIPVLRNSLVIPNSRNPKQFAEFIRLVDSLPNHEVCLRGLCQLSLECFKELYNLVREIFELPDINEEPDIIRFEDKSFIISWWEHLVYRTNFDDIEDRNLLAQRINSQVFHKDYLEGPL